MTEQFRWPWTELYRRADFREGLYCHPDGRVWRVCAPTLVLNGYSDYLEAHEQTEYMLATYFIDPGYLDRNGFRYVEESND